MEQQHRHHESGESCAMCPVLPSLKAVLTRAPLSPVSPLGPGGPSGPGKPLSPWSRQNQHTKPPIFSPTTAVDNQAWVQDEASCAIPLSSPQPCPEGGGHSWARVTFSPTPATLGAWRGSRGDHAGHCPWLPVPGLGQAEVDPLGSITYWLARWSWIALQRDRCHCQPLPQQTPATPLGPHFALTFSPRGPAGPGAPCGKIRALRGLAVPGNMHPGHGSSWLHSTTLDTLSHLSA